MSAAAVLQLVALALLPVFFLLVASATALQRRGALQDPSRRPLVFRASVGAGAVGIVIGALNLVAAALDLSSGARTLGETWLRLIVGVVFTVANAMTLRRWLGARR